MFLNQFPALPYGTLMGHGDDESGMESAEEMAVALTLGEHDVRAVNWIGSPGALVLSKLLACNGSLNELSVRENGIGDEGAKALAIALTPNAEGVFNGSLNTLDLDVNGIGPEGAKALAVALTPNEQGVFNGSLNTLNLADNQLCGVDEFGRGTYDASGIKALADALAFNGSLNTLDLRINDIGDEGAKALAVALTPNAEGVFNTSLNTLDLTDNRIGTEGAKALAVALTPNAEGVFNTSLNTLNLTNNEIGPEGAKALAVALTPNAEGVFNGSLNTLNLWGNKIGPEGAKALAAALTPNEEGVFNGSLNTLDVCNNDITGEAALQLAEAVLKHPCMKEFNRIMMQDIRDDKVQELDLNHSYIEDPGVLVLSKLLVFNTSLNTLDLYYNNLGDEGAKALAVALTPNAEGVFNTSLNTLNLRSNAIGPEGAKALAVALTPNAEGVFNTSLNTLDLSSKHFPTFCCLLQLIEPSHRHQAYAEDHHAAAFLP
ncbi:hypothetical protein CYMTET_5435 [Cymbomonas tetramitiformis]|uniref:Uncharacterized protein n=1 Tax=Cymbomonas tetramitiformis TaxID=36881 RepID=A0AAE0GZD2_9CHLO|nr:hypothetical protein CYMTET_5435 [Cymbomonas tetramitiformis]